MKLFGHIILQIFVLTTAVSGYGVTLDYPCVTMKQVGALTESYTQDEANKINEWALNCLPEKQSDFLRSAHMFFHDSSGQGVVKTAIPVFALEEKVNDPESIFGAKLIYSNPENYIYPIEEILKDPTSAPCDVPANYSLITFCLADSERGQ